MTGRTRIFTTATIAWASLLLPIAAHAQNDEPAGTIAAIDAEFDRELIKLEKTRLEKLAALAASKTGAEADLAYEACFRVAIESNLYAEAQAAARNAIKADGTSPQVALLANLVNLVAEANRGEFEASLKQLEATIEAAPRDRKTLPVAMKLSLLEAYYQRLVQGGRFDIARRAITSIRDQTQEPAIKDLVERRLKQVDLVGKAAPEIEGTDIDGKPYRLSDHKGKPVLVVFWATWCLPNAQEVAAFGEAYKLYHDTGLQIVGINLDAFQDDVTSVESVVPEVKRFLIERNVRWPNLIERPGDRNLANAYGVTDIPSNALVGKDGKIVQIDLTAANLQKVLSQEMSR